MSQTTSTHPAAASAAADLTSRLRDVLDDLAGVLDRIDGTEATLDARPTPCTDYALADLRQHVVGWLTAFADGFAAADGACSDADGVQVEGSGAAQVRAAAARLLAALDAGAVDRPLSIAGAPMPGEMAARMVLWEYQVHGWDLAAATDQAWQPGESGLEDSLRFAPGLLTGEFQGVGKVFGPRVPVPADAPALARLLGLSGRDPGWTRPAVAPA